MPECPRPPAQLQRLSSPALKGESQSMFSVIVSSDPTAWETDQITRMFSERFNKFSGAEGASIGLERPESLKALEGGKPMLMYEKGTTGTNADSVRYGLLRAVRHAGEYVT